MEIKGKVAIITGASSGIGKAISYKLASSGYMLALVARTGEKLDSVKKEYRATWWKCDWYSN